MIRKKARESDAVNKIKPFDHRIGDTMIYGVRWKSKGGLMHFNGDILAL